MKHAKILALLAVAVAALTAFSASASAATITSPTGTTYSKSISATSTNSALDGAFVTVTCSHSEVTAGITSQGAGQTIKASVSTLDFTSCNFPVKVEANGTLELHAINPKTPHETCNTGKDNCWGTLTSTGAKVKIETSLGNCVFTTNATSVGTVTPTSQTGATGVLDIAGAIPRTEGSFLCGSSGTWTGNYTVNTPDNFWLDQ